jgi:hypothetical protein
VQQYERCPAVAMDLVVEVQAVDVGVSAFHAGPTTPGLRTHRHCGTPAVRRRGRRVQPWSGAVEMRRALLARPGTMGWWPAKASTKSRSAANRGNEAEPAL